MIWMNLVTFRKSWFIVLTANYNIRSIRKNHIGLYKEIIYFVNISTSIHLGLALLGLIYFLISTVYI